MDDAERDIRQQLANLRERRELATEQNAKVNASAQQSLAAALAALDNLESLEDGMRTQVDEAVRQADAAIDAHLANVAARVEGIGESVEALRKDAATLRAASVGEASTHQDDLLRGLGVEAGDLHQLADALVTASLMLRVRAAARGHGLL